MSQSAGASERQIRVKFDSGFQSDAVAHHVTRRDVERVLRWPRWIDELTAGTETSLAEVVTAWVGRPPMPDPRDPSLLLVVTRDRRSDRRVFDAWRLYFSDIDLSRARSGSDVLAAFLDCYGFMLQLGAESRRLFFPGRIPMGPGGNASVRIDGAEPGAGVRPLEVTRLVPERFEIEVGIAFAVNEAVLRADLARHAWGDDRILRAFS